MNCYLFCIQKVNRRWKAEDENFSHENHRIFLFQTKKSKNVIDQKKYSISHSAVCTKWIIYSSNTKLRRIIMLWSNKIELVHIFKRTFWSNDFYDPPSLQPLAWEIATKRNFLFRTKERLPKKPCNSIRSPGNVEAIVKGPRGRGSNVTALRLR